MRQIENSEVESYIKERALYFRCCAQLTENRLVSGLSRSYNRLADNLPYIQNYAQLKEHCKNGMHAEYVLEDSNIAEGVVIRDTFMFLETGKPLLRHDIHDYLFDIERLDLKNRIRKESKHGPSYSQIEAQRKIFEAKQREDEIIEAYLLNNTISMEVWQRTPVGERQKIIDNNRAKVLAVLTPKPIKKNSKPKLTIQEDNAIFVENLRIRKEERQKQK